MVLDPVGSRPSWGMDSTPSGSSGAQSVVLVHGAYADGSSWSSVIPYLLDAGLSVTAVQHSLESLQDSVDATRRALALSSGPTVLVGHSFAGTLISEAGVAAIRAKSMRQTARLVELAEAHGYPLRAPRDPARRGGTVAFDVDHGYEVAQYLLSRDVVVDYRPGAGIRVAPHFYTTDAELEAAVATIAEALETGGWQEHRERRSVVT